ncbi:MAG: hypothetical protein ACRDIY_19990 [Chloroflexota bacterium]
MTGTILDECLLTVAGVVERIRVWPVTIHDSLQSGRRRGIRQGETEVGWRIAGSEVHRFRSSADGAIRD